MSNRLGVIIFYALFVLNCNIELIEMYPFQSIQQTQTDILF